MSLGVAVMWSSGSFVACALNCVWWHHTHFLYVLGASFQEAWTLGWPQVAPCHSSLFQHIEHLPDTLSQRRCASLHPTRRVLCLHSVDWHVSRCWYLGQCFFLSESYILATRLSLNQSQLTKAHGGRNNRWVGNEKLTVRSHLAPLSLLLVFPSSLWSCLSACSHPTLPRICVGFLQSECQKQLSVEPPQ